MILCLFDMFTAFDAINHDTLFQVLSARMGIRGKVLDWFMSYVMHRCQSACESGAISASRHLTFGFPPGSVTGPNSFSFYSDPVPQIGEQHSISIHIYADDTQLYLPFALNETDANRAVIQMEDCIDDIWKWMTHNELKLNEEKQIS